MKLHSSLPIFTIMSFLAALGAASAARGQTDVGDAASLQNAINAGDTDIVLTGNIAVTSPIYIGTTSTPTLTIDGAGNSITGTSELFFIQSGTVSLSNATLTGAAVGGNGGTGQDGGGGAAGMGGAIFVGATANVSVSGVQFTNNAATGGSGGASINFQSGFGGGGGVNGGNGGSATTGGGGGGGNGGNAGSDINSDNGSGGGGLASAGGSPPNNTTGGTGGGPNGGAGGVGGGFNAAPGGNATGPNSGGGGGTFGMRGNGGGGAGSINGGGGGAGAQFGSSGGSGGEYGGGGGSLGPGGNAGFGGGGGAGYSAGGTGGFGGGGGAGTVTGVGGVGGGSGQNSYLGAGGGGAGLGGAVFVQAGGTLTVTGTQSFTGSSVTAGTGFTNGAAAGSDLFLMSGTTTTLAPGTGNTVTLNGTIADDSLASLPSGQSYTAGNGAGAAITIGSAGSAGGTVVFNGANTYSGGTTVSSGTLNADNNSALGTGAVTVSSGGSLQVSGAAKLDNNITISGTGDGGAGAIFASDGLQNEVFGTVTLAGDASINVQLNGILLHSTIDLGAHTLTTGGPTAGEVEILGHVIGTGGLTVAADSRTLITSQTSDTYTGVTTVSTGATLNLGDFNGAVAIPGDLDISGTVETLNSSQLASNTVVTLSGSGQFLFNTFSNSTESFAGLNGSSGTLIAHNPNGMGSQSDALILSGSGSYSYAGQINDTLFSPHGSATISLTKNGTGTQILTGTNDYSGGTTISAGVLQLGDGFTPGASLGSGDVTVNGTGTFTLNLANGETFANNIHDNDAVILDDSPNSNYTVSSTIDGSGSVTKLGANTIYLVSANSYSGGTFIYGGALVAGNSDAFGTGPVVNNALLTTDTSVHGLTVSVGGDFTNGPNGVLRLAIYAPGDYDSIQLTNPGSVAHLNGELLIVVPANVAAVAGHTYDLITSSNGVQGQFASVVTSLASIGATVAYTNNAAITLQLTQLPFADLGPYTSNELAVARNVDANAQNTTSGSLSRLVTVLNGLSSTPGALASAFNQLTPTTFGQFAGTTAIDNASFATESRDSYLATQRSGANGTFVGGNGSIDTSGLTIHDPSYDPSLQMVHSRLLAWNAAPLGVISDSPDALLGGVEMKDMKEMQGGGGGEGGRCCCGAVASNPWNFYIQGNVILAQGFSQPGISHFDDNTESVQAGADYRVTPNLLVGLAAGYGHSDATLDNDGSSATVDSYSPGFYASYADHGWYANLSGDYIHNAYTQNRVIGFLGQTATSAPEGNEGVANLDGGYDFHLGALTCGPLAGVQYTHLTVDGYTEIGSIADLSVNEQDIDSLRSRLGGRLSYAFSRYGINFTPHLDASWQHEFLDQSRGITSQFNGGVGSFSVKTSNPSRDSALVDAGLDAELNRTVTVFADYEVEAGQDNYFGQSIQAGAKIGF